MVENKGDLDLFIKNFPVKNPKTGQSLDKKAIRPHEKIQLNYFYKPEKIGPFESAVVIKTNDRDHPVFHLPVRGTAVNKPSPKKG